MSSSSSSGVRRDKEVTELQDEEGNETKNEGDKRQKTRNEK
jgi:hypothetical protein